MSPTPILPIRLTSEGRHSLTLTVERAGRDLLCRVHGGDAHIGAAALSEWRDGRAHTRCLSAEGHREEAIARHAAHGLCGAARCTVTCVAGIHFDDVSRAEIEAISADAYALARQVARDLRDERILAEVTAPGGTLARIASRRDGYAEVLEEIYSRPAAAALETYAGEIEAVSDGGVGREVRIFAPLYLSNACTNDCVYCGFRRSSDYERTRLSVEEAVAEAEALHVRGIRSIDLVTGEIPADPFVDYVCEVTAAILERTEIGRVHLNLGSLTTGQYARLRESGAAGYHLYQETYDPEAYLRTHRGGGKREMAWRLEAPHRVATAGFQYVGMGVLLGLADLGGDLSSLIGHASLLREDFPALGIGFSLPRVQTMEADPDYVATRPVSDDDFVRAVLFLRLADTEAHLTLTTRERPEIRDRLVRCGVTRLSAGVSTAPGGYATGHAAGETARATGGVTAAREQFHISDERSVAEIAALVKQAGLTPVFE